MLSLSSSPFDFSGNFKSCRAWTSSDSSGVIALPLTRAMNLSNCSMDFFSDRSIKIHRGNKPSGKLSRARSAINCSLTVSTSPIDSLSSIQRNASSCVSPSAREPPGPCSLKPKRLGINKALAIALSWPVMARSNACVSEG